MNIDEILDNRDKRDFIWVGELAEKSVELGQDSKKYSIFIKYSYSNFILKFLF